MRAISFALLLAADITFAASVNNEKRQLVYAAPNNNVLGAIGNGGYGRISNAAAAKMAGVPLAQFEAKLPKDVQILESPVKADGVTVKRVKIRTGPYSVANMNKRNFMSGHYGMLESYYDMKIQRPCPGQECNILRQEGGLEYYDGTNANIDTGLWLHHMVHFNTGPRRWDPVGITSRSLQGCIPMEGVKALGGATFGYGGVGPTAKNTERYFVTGNERTPFNYYKKTESGKGSAYHLDSQDKFMYLVELMNMKMEDAVVYITMNYDIVDGKLPSGWDDVKTVFLDANSCGSSELDSPSGADIFVADSAKSFPYRANIEGRVVDSMGHLHDGGVTISTKADSKDLCTSTSVYSSPEAHPQYYYAAAAKMTNVNKDKVAEAHIAKMAGCGQTDINVPEMKQGQTWTVSGKYDYTKAKPNMEKGVPSDVMAIAIVLVAVPAGKYDRAP